jgi:hypothetical protein
LPTEALPTRTSYDTDEKNVDDVLLDKWIPLPVGELLAAKTNLDMIIALKDYAKAQVASTQVETEREVAMAVYYASIANAQAYHGQMITSHSNGHLSKAYARLARQQWIANKLKDLFHKAISIAGD